MNCLQIILQTKQKMNILSSEQMHQVQNILLKIELKSAYVLKTPEEREYQNTNHFSGSIFPPATPSTQKEIQRMVTLTDNLCCLKLANPNSVYQMLAYSLLSILYQDKYRHNMQNQSEATHYLLETIKCSLYSPDVEFSCLKNIDFVVDTLQMKAMAARFLAFMEDRSLRLTVNRLKCALWILQHNPLLLTTLVLLFRFILFRLQIEGTNNYFDPGNPEETIVNLIEYFDLSYRSLGNLFLFYDEGIFLAFTEREVIAGDYFQNENDKRNQKQQLQIKSSVKMNMIESFLVNVDEKSSLVAPKKIGMVESDLKMMNFILDSSSQDGQFFAKSKDSEMETPTFNDNPELFHFGKKKKESNKVNQDIKFEFERLIMDNSECSQQYNEQQQQEASTPFLGGSHNYTLASRFEPTANQIIKQIDSPIDELDRVQNIPPQKSRIQGDLLIIKKNMTQSDPNEQVFTPSTLANKTMGFSLGANQQYFFNFCPQDKMSELEKLLSCQCRDLRIQRNAINSKVVVVGYVPEQPANRPSLQAKSVTNISKYNGNQPIKQSRNHKPSFLKNLKKNKQARQEMYFAKSTVTQTLKRDSSFMRDNRQHYASTNFKKSSDIIHQNYAKNYGNQQSKMFQKETDHKSCKSLNFNQYNNMSSFQNGLNKNEQFIKRRQANPFNQRHRDCYDPNQVNNGDISSRFSPKYKPNQPYKFYAPVQIIAPTVYFGSNSHNSNNMVFKVGQYNKSENPQSKTPQLQIHKKITDQYKFYSNIPKGASNQRTKNT